MRGLTRLFIVLGLLCALLPMAASPGARADEGPAPSATAIALDGEDTGRTFDGIGAISGGGGNSRLLIDYPEPQRTAILDYLFKPGYGANLQILKAEIGGDTNSTDGAEPSHMHTADDLNCDRGYEWWLMAEAKKRNPAIKLYGLAWGAPGWIGGGEFWSEDMTDYLLKWLGCASRHHLSIDYLGGWNERGYDKTWYERTHTALREHGYATRLVGADSGWEVADDILKDDAFAGSVDIIGAHYPCEGGDGGTALSCSTTQAARDTKKPLWASENGSLDTDAGAPELIRSITRGYLDAEMTAYLNWPLIASVYPGLPYDTVGLAVAAQPWSGAYRLGKSLWTTAQVTQFTRPGWAFMDHASGYLGGERGGGSYVSLRSPGNTAYSTIVETTTATRAQRLDLSVGEGLPRTPVQVWETDVSAPDAKESLAHTTTLVPDRDGRYSLDVRPGRVYTLTTLDGGGKGRATSPAARALTLPYADDFDRYPVGREARYLADMQGSYETVRCQGRRGTCLRQMAPVKPIEWQDDSDAYALIGDGSWADYTVSADVLLDRPGPVELIGRAGRQARPQNRQEGYFLRVDDKGAWSLSRSDTEARLTPLASGTAKALGTGRWHHLALTMSGTTLTAALDGEPLGAVDDTAYSRGIAGLGVAGYQTDQFDNLRVTPAAKAPAPAAVHVTAPTRIERGETGLVRAAFTVPTAAGSGARDVTLTPSAAAPGWTFAPGAVRFPRVRPGQTVSVKWRATAPDARDTPVDNVLTATAAYERSGVPHWSYGSATVTVPIPPPTGTVAVSDLAFVAQTNGWGPVERDQSNGERQAGDGHPLTLGGTVHAKGLGVHANGEVGLSLGGNCTRFTAVVGVDDEVAPNGSAVFTVVGDGKELATTPLLRNDAEPYPLSVDVSGVSRLDLRIGDGGDTNANDHGDWADARLICSET
ncbi:NPCBM/NEW2 domain-containing protein [Streptomyces sp. NPDC019937]|uniref:NPCBM/NEW2 domain-containing protein n=1 Tax=Streptomyces sp. NPDC019937 TaxID=3154787 RepID=UPI0033F1F2E4